MEVVTKGHTGWQLQHPPGEGVHILLFAAGEYRDKAEEGGQGMIWRGHCHAFPKRRQLQAVIFSSHPTCKRTKRREKVSKTNRQLHFPEVRQQHGKVFLVRRGQAGILLEDYIHHFRHEKD